MADYDWSTWEEAGTEDWSDADVNDIDKIYHEQIKESWDNSYQNPVNYNTVRNILDQLGL